MSVDYESRDGVALITMDDGKVNALSSDLLGELEAALARAQEEATAVVVAGRAGRFSAGFDLGELRGGMESAASLLSKGAETALRLYELPKPVVLACTGHALAMGAILLFTGDLRLGASGAFKIGMNETSIGLELPGFAMELARDRLSKRYFVRAGLLAEIYDPKGAADAGYLDRVTAPESLVEEAVADAKRLSALDPTAFSITKARMRKESSERVRATLREGLSTFGASD